MSFSDSSRQEFNRIDSCQYLECPFSRKICQSSQRKLLQFTSVSVQEKRGSSHLEITSIDEEKGVARALKVDKSTIAHGLAGKYSRCVGENENATSQTIGVQGSSLNIAYQLFW